MLIQRYTDFIIRIVNRPRRLAFLFLVLIFGTATGYSLMEHRSFFDSLWWTVVTACTVGYGDQYPNTEQGRVLAGFIMLTMILFVVPLITAQLASKLIVNRDAFTHEEQEAIKNAVLILPELRELLITTQQKLDVVYREVDDVEEQNLRFEQSEQEEVNLLSQVAEGVVQLLERVPAVV